MIGRVNTGGGSGGTLTVTAPAGVTVTVSKDGKSYTKTADTSGVAVFKGLKTGAWTVTITDGAQTATRSVVVTADYACTIAFFTATINVTYPAGSTCTATDGVTTLTAPDTSGTWVCVVGNTGTWTVTATDGEKEKSETVEITTDGQSETIAISYNVFLFKEGTGALVPFKIKTETYGRVEITESSIYKYHTSNSKPRSAVFTEEPVDITDFKTVCFDADARNKYGDFADGIGVSQTEISNGGVANSKGAYTIFTYDSVRRVYSLDVSSLSGLYYIGTGGITTSYIYNIWLE